MVDKKQKGKKRWFTILAPQIFNSKEIAEITAYAPEDLKGRFVEVTGHMLTGIPRDSSRKYKLKVSTITGEKVATTAHRYYIAEGFVQRSVRRYKERFAFVLNAQTKDEKTSFKVKEFDMMFVARNLKQLFNQLAVGVDQLRQHANGRQKATDQKQHKPQNQGLNMPPALAPKHEDQKTEKRPARKQQETRGGKQEYLERLVRRVDANHGRARAPNEPEHRIEQP